MNAMKSFAVVAIAALSCVTGPSIAGDNDDAAQTRQQLDAMSDQALKNLFAEERGAKQLYKQAAGYAVFRATKGGFLVTGAGGTGVAVNKKTERKTYMHMGSGGVGLGAGLQNYRLIVLFQTQAALDKFIEHGWDASTSAQAAAGKAGVSATSSFTDGLAVYQLTDKGLMAQADLSGTHFWKSDKLNPPSHAPGS
jgi:lipid-binding SYLF domain-containing protein